MHETYTAMPVAEKEEHRRRRRKFKLTARKSTFRILLRLGGGSEVEEVLTRI
jgi:hypothetical protein